MALVNLPYEPKISFMECPEFLTSTHLVALGLYANLDAAYQDRRDGKGPAYIQTKRKVLYPKASVRKWIDDNLIEPSSVAWGFTEPPKFTDTEGNVMQVPKNCYLVTDANGSRFVPMESYQAELLYKPLHPIEEEKK